MIDRRSLITRSAAMAATAAFGPRLARAADAATATLPFGNGERPLVRYPQKRPLIRQTSRPPQLETPFEVFDEGPITPNDAFFVRYHLAGIPYDLDPDKFTLDVSGKVDRPLKLSLAEIKAMPASEIVAVNQCSGNSRSFFDPRVAGGQLGNGAMGNARWRGVALKTVLDRAGVQAGARQVTFNGMDVPIVDRTPDFVKALDIDHARDGEVLLAYAMNGEALPLLNGFPLRLVVPGFYGTYWVKHVDEITVIDGAFDGFWMKSAYRIPDTDCACVEPGAVPKATVPINRFDVRSFITNLADGAKVAAHAPLVVRGIAFDGGSGIRNVDLSVDGGTTWQDATLGEDLGRYSFRPWQATLTLPPGAHAIKVRATTTAGETQPAAARWNPAGYMRNVIETVSVTAA
ncbi:MAG: molybdopterin-dependent oxidoreductase [Xanthobacteraceae bacterium]|nr:molybdopterin-dependent oxidoreductase [Xanthobacteraceae bacterium]